MPQKGGVTWGGVWERQIKDHLEDVRKWAANGESTAAIASRFQITSVRLNQLAKQHPELRKAIDEGRTSLVGRIRFKLVERALGESVEEDTHTVSEVIDGRPVVKKVETFKKRLPPDPSSIFGMLNLIDPDYVSDRARFMLACQQAGIDVEGKREKQLRKELAKAKKAQKKAEETQATAPADQQATSGEAKAAKPSVEDMEDMLMRIIAGDYSTLAEARMKSQALRDAIAERRKSERATSSKDQNDPAAEMAARLFGREDASGGGDN